MRWVKARIAVVVVVVVVVAMVVVFKTITDVKHPSHGKSCEPWAKRAPINNFGGGDVVSCFSRTVRVRSTVPRG